MKKDTSLIETEDLFNLFKYNERNQILRGHDGSKE